MKTLLKSNHSYIGLIFILSIILFMSIMIAVTIGSTSISITEVYNVLINEIKSHISKGMIRDIIIYIRLPRLILAVAVGMGLAVSGVVMQAIVKNPLADPYILGISSGASLGATIAIMLGIGTIFGANYIGMMGCLGAFAVSMAVLILSNVGSRSNSIKLLLAGMALSSLCSAFSSFIIYIAPDKDGMMTITYWLMGSLAGAEWRDRKSVV